MLLKKYAHLEKYYGIFDVVKERWYRVGNLEDVWSEYVASVVDSKDLDLLLGEIDDEFINANLENSILVAVYVPKQTVIDYKLFIHNDEVFINQIEMVDFKDVQWQGSKIEDGN